MYSGMSAACSCMRCFCRALQATCYCDCSLCGLQLQHIAAGTESFSGDWKKPILRFSFCKGLHIPFVKNLCCHRECGQALSSKTKSVLTPLGPREVTAALIGEHQKSKKIVV